MRLPLSSLRLLSWNLFGLSDDHLDLRTEAALFVALLGGPPEVMLLRDKIPPPPDVLMFQEVVERSYLAHLKPHLLAAGYALFPSEPHPEREYFEVIAVLGSHRVVSWAREPLDSAQGRELVSVVTEMDGRHCLWMTAHLESMIEGKPQRITQSMDIIQRLGSHQGPAVFAGDTNLRDAEVTLLEDDGPLLDAWESCGAPPSERWTRSSGRTGHGQRYDRIWGRGVRFSGFGCLGREPVTPDGQPPSDHLGVEVTLRPDEFPGG